MGKDHELLEAARNGNISVVEKILNQKAKRTGPLASLRRGPGANAQDSTGYSALHHAALNGHTDIVRLLLAHDASPNLPDTRGSSPLHLAAWAGHQDIVKLFLIHVHRPANPNLQTIENDTPLHCAAQHGHTGALTTLLAHGADPNVTNSRNETPLDLAAQYGRLQAVQMLIRAHPGLLLPFKTGDSCNDSSQSLSSTSSPRTNNAIVHHSPLHLASRNGHKNVVEVLLVAGVNVNLLTPSGTALHEAALCGKDSVVRTLLDFGADLDATDCEGRTALDILEEFPPHVTKGIVSVINSHRNSTGHMYDEYDDGRGDSHYHHHHHRNHSSQFEHNRGSPIQNYYNSQHYIPTSPSSSLGSLGPPSPRSRTQTSGSDVPEFYITMAPIQPKTTAPKKPPRRNLSVSPTHLQPQQQSSQSSNHSSPQLMSMSVDGSSSSYSNGGGGGGSGGVGMRSGGGPYEYISLARTGLRKDDGAGGGEKSTNRAYSIDQYVEMSSGAPRPAPRTIGTVTYENTTLRSYNPNRKLKRNRNSYETFNIDFNKDKSKDSKTSTSSDISNTTSSSIKFSNIPASPTNYQQPPTPEHPPPSAMQAEKFIHELIRPLSQEYKRRSGLILAGIGNMTESGTSPQDGVLCSSLCASSGSISSSVSMSDRSVSTDCVEEFIGDVPFAGLFKGSTMNLSNANFGGGSGGGGGYYQDNYPPPKVRNAGVFNHHVSRSAAMKRQEREDSERQGRLSTFKSQERPKTLQTSFSQQQERKTQRVYIETTPEKVEGIGGGGENFASGRGRSGEATGGQAGALVRNKRSLSCGGVLDDDKDYGADEKKADGAESQNGSLYDDDEKRYRINSYLNRQHTTGSIGSAGAGSGIGKRHLKQRTNSEEVLSPFNEEEAWAKISEIMESFGSGILNSTNDYNNKTNSAKQISDVEVTRENEPLSTSSGHQYNVDVKYSKLNDLLSENDMRHLVEILIDNGYDNPDFLNGILEESDLIQMGISLADRRKLLDVINNLPIAQSLPILHSSNNNSMLNVDQWLHSIQLSDYIDIFRNHLYTNMEGVCRVWEVELQTVLEITKVGHRKRILHSVSSNRKHSSNVTEQKLNGELKNLSLKSNEKPDGDTVATANKSSTIKAQKTAAGGVVRHSNKKNRPAPQPPNRAPSLEIRAPSELLLGLPSNLRTQWRHSSNTLFSSSVKYDVFYLGSTVVKELRGTESTRKSIQKLKRDDRISLSTATTPQLQLPQQQTHQQQAQQKQPVRLAISHCGVEFIDIQSNGTICEHEIRNINCACQDADDLSHFAYITKDSKADTHFCHVFNVDSMDLATEIILTLGQAFEVAYQLALRDTSATTSAASSSKTTPQHAAVITNNFIKH